MRRNLNTGFLSITITGSVPSNFGQELVRGLLNADPTLAVPSSSVAASLIRGSTRAKVYMLQLPVEAAPGTGGPHRLVLPTLASTISSYFDVQGAHFPFLVRVLSAFANMSSQPLTQFIAGAPQEEHARPLATAAASLLVEWLDECPKAVSALLACPGWVDATSAAVIERCVAREKRKNAEKRKNLNFCNAHQCPLFNNSPQASSLRRFDLLFVCGASGSLHAPLRRRCSGMRTRKRVKRDFRRTAEK